MKDLVAVKLSYIGHAELLFYVVGQKPIVESNISTLLNAYNEKYAEVSFSSGTKVVVEELNSVPLVDITEKPLQAPELFITDTGFIKLTDKAAEKRKALSVLENIVDEGISLASVEAMVKYFAMYPHVLEEAKNA